MTIPKVNFGFIKTELTRGVITAFAGIHDMKLTLKRLIKSGMTTVGGFLVPENTGGEVF